MHAPPRLTSASSFIVYDVRSRAAGGLPRGALSGSILATELCLLVLTLFSAGDMFGHFVCVLR